MVIEAMKVEMEITSPGHSGLGYNIFCNIRQRAIIMHGFRDVLKQYQQAGKIIMRIFRYDLQLHFFWGFILTLLGVYWPPLFVSGFAVTVIKEVLDLWSKGRWSWGDFWCGVLGSMLSLAYLHSQSAVLDSQG